MASPYARQHDLDCKCPQCAAHEQLRVQHVTSAPPLQGQPTGAVPLREFCDYKVLEDWSDD